MEVGGEFLAVFIVDRIYLQVFSLFHLSLLVTAECGSIFFPIGMSHSGVSVSCLPDRITFLFWFLPLHLFAGCDLHTSVTYYWD